MQASEPVAPTDAFAGVSVVMPVRNEARFIECALASVLRAGEGIGGFEVLVVDGMSDDGTREAVASAAAADQRVRLLDNPMRTVPHAMNIGIRAAGGDVIVRVDGHAEVAPDFVTASLTELAAHPECACVGGAIENVDLDELSSAISLAMSSPFGVGNARFRTGGKAGYVDTLAFGAYRRQDLIDIGLFDEELVRNQDDELNFRLLKAGRRIWLSDKISSRYFVRSSLGKLFRQYFQYGYWKVYVNRKHSTVTNLRQLVPPLFVGALAVQLALAPFWPFARLTLLLTLLLYLAAAAGFALRARSTLRQATLLIASFMTLHVGYGLGYLAGLRDFALLGKRPSARSAELSR